MNNRDELTPEEIRLSRLLATAGHDAPPPDREFLKSLKDKTAATFAAAEPPPVCAHIVGSRRWTRWLIPAAAACVAIAAMVGFWPRQPLVQSAYAQLLQAVENTKASEWVYSRFKNSDGELLEFWMSFKPYRCIIKGGQEITYTDQQAGKRWRYDTKLGTFTVQPMADNDMKANKNNFLETILTGLKDRESKGAQFTRAQETLGGKTYTTYRLADPKDGLTTVRVDPVTQKIVKMVTVSQKAPDSSGGVTTLDFEYPESGPADIYALGVPRDAKLINLIPTTELLALDSKARAAQDGFAPSYFALECQTDGEDVVRSKVLAIYKKGGKYRIELYGGLRDKTLVDDFNAFEAWTKRTSVQKITFKDTNRKSPMGMGFVYTVTVRPDRQGGVAKGVAPSLIKSESNESPDTVESLSWYGVGYQPTIGATIISDPSNTQSGLILRQWTCQGVLGEGKVDEYPMRNRWNFDPQHDYIVSRFESVDDTQGEWQLDKNWLQALAANPAVAGYRRVFTWEILESAQTPQGQWYAAKGRISWKTGGKDYWRVHLDTARAMPDELFDPGRLDASIFARGENQPGQKGK